MLLYRIAPTLYADDLSGTGGLYRSGRWHTVGTRIIYTSEHVSLTMLETLANWTRLPEGVSLVTLEIPDSASVRNLERNTFPNDWNLTPAPFHLSEITDEWIKKRQHWLMRVPSIHSPTEFNYLLNPLHPEHKTLKVVSIESIIFDPRLK
ncbi:RES family NAD+ phosphorylase [Larkinella sp. C7]|jgi:RES domain-containing protein|uniref:RES family NAD+ phosphorylase n=1 Tax=Larkinella sp. C7 TaxID=2576607 RepID=UPI0011112059|nr:RES family NAD+ phosphorylase [Larkinella sp. C7]